MISVITPTWKRYELLTRRCIPSVQAQTYVGEIEHVIVSDGSDPELSDYLKDVPGVRYFELEQHSSVGIWGEYPRAYGIEMSKGEYIAYLDDDNAFRPRHLEVLARALDEMSVAGFAYSQQARWSGDAYTLIGHNLPAFCDIDTSMIMHRREILDIATWRIGYNTIDWDIVERWMNSGIQWVFVPEVTNDYYVR